MHTLQEHVVVIGSGPAGLMAAVSAAGQGAQVTLLEALPSPGRKLLASGAGKCNFTNMLSAEAMAERFAPEQRRFVKAALLGFTPEDCRDFFCKHGVEHKLVDDFYCFPRSDRAADILNVFLTLLEKYNVKIVCNATVSDISVKDSTVQSVTAQGIEYYCDYLIAAGGGPGFPRLGGGGSLDKLVSNINVPVNNRYPALCSIKSNALWLKPLAGIVLDDAGIVLDKKNSTRGVLLFTGDGISGPAALDMAGRAAKLVAFDPENTSLKINFTPQRSREEWLQKINILRQNNGKKLAVNALKGELPQALLQALIAEAGAEACTLAQLNKNMIGQMLENFCEMKFSVSRVDSWEKAMASTGGVDRSVINPRTMQCKIYRNLYFAGEFIDVDGPCGGYNIQWALSSGYLAGLLR